jgi:multiple sugar transport system ATP-binding protein
VLLKKLKTDLTEVFVGIRPEGFTYVEKGVLDAEVFLVETIGRDTTLIIKDPTQIIEPLAEPNQGDDVEEVVGVKSVFEQKTFKVIVDSQHRIMPGDKVSFNIRPEKLFVFNKETGELV